MNNDTIRKKGYITNLITDMSIDWMENSRDKKKPFCLLIHHKAIHRNWLPEIKNLSLYEDKVFPLPENFHDDYEGRIAAASQEMGIAEDMDLIYDLKMLKDGQESRLKKTYECMLNRMDSLERKQFEDFYAPITEEFYKLNLKGKELAEWKYQRYMRDYMKVVKSLDDNVGRILDYLETKVCWKIHWWFIPLIRDSTWVSTDGLTNVSCMRSLCTHHCLCICPKG